MASFTTDQRTGRRTVQFVAPDGKRKSVRLGKVSKREAEEFRGRVERLLAARMTNVSPDRETAGWVDGLPKQLHARLAAAGLTEPRKAADAEPLPTLGEFVDAYLAGRTDHKPNTKENCRTMTASLLAHLGRDKPLREVTAGDADGHVVYLRGKGLAEATIGRRIKMAKQVFRAAMRKKLLTENPFADVKPPAQTNELRKVFVTREMVALVLDACPDAEYRLIVALARYGGLRTPSETLALTWPDVDWERGRLRVDSPKTGLRFVPLFPELRPYLEAVFEQAAEGSTHVITTYRNPKKNFRTRFLRVIRRAGLEPWTKPFQNLRASRETELAATFPLHVVCKWIGNSEVVAQNHYLQVTEEHFTRALQNPVRQPAATSRTEMQAIGGETQKEVSCDGLRDGAELCDVSQYAWRDSNPQPSAP